ncbi:MAG: hypothetical protein RIS76_3376 [Verrucomicrobiota bacterium]
MRLPLLLILLLTAVLPRQTLATTELDEVHRLLSTNLPALGPDDLSAPTVDALVVKLSPRVRWAGSETNAVASGETIAGARRFPGDLGYLRLSHVSGDVAARLETAVDDLQKQGPLRGLVIDLRFATGRDFPASARASALFFSSAQPVLDWGDGSLAAPGRTNWFSGPVALLVNPETRGSAETLAAALRSAGLGMVIGGKTAGEAAQWREFALSSGRVLRLAVAPVKTGDGAVIPVEGLVPDIGVQTTLDADRRFLSDPYSSGATSSSGEVTAAMQVRRRLTEAELIRTKRQALGQPELPAGSTHVAGSDSPPKPTPTVQDPVLARGLDLLTGLNAVRE